MSEFICGIQVRVTDVVPDDVIGVSNGQYLSLFWQGAEIGRIHPFSYNGWWNSADCVAEHPDQTKWLTNSHT